VDFPSHLPAGSPFPPGNAVPPGHAPYPGQVADAGQATDAGRTVARGHAPHPHQVPYPTDHLASSGQARYAGQAGAPGHMPFPGGGAPYSQAQYAGTPYPAAPYADVRAAGFPGGEQLLGERTPPPGRPAARRGFVKAGVVAAAATLVVAGGTAGAIAMTGGSDTTETETSVVSMRTPSAVELRNAEDARHRLSAQRATRAARRDFTRRPSLAPKGTPLPGDAAGGPVPVGEAQKIAKALLPKYGFDPDTQFGCLVELWERESHWRTTAGSPGGPYGIPQANPGSKMSSAGPDWQNDATTQIKWGLEYIKARYDGPCDAWATFKSRGWY
jgi:hypothetical protein